MEVRLTVPLNPDISRREEIDQMDVRGGRSNALPPHTLVKRVYVQAGKPEPKAEIMEREMDGDVLIVIVLLNLTE